MAPTETTPGFCRAAQHCFSASSLRTALGGNAIAAS